MPDKGLKRAVITGAVIGALMSLGAAFAMDFILSDSLQGSWRDAAAKDVTKIFGASCGQNYWAVTLVLVFVMGFLAAFGAMLGVAAGAIMNRLFRLLLK